MRNVHGFTSIDQNRIVIVFDRETSMIIISQTNFISFAEMKQSNSIFWRLKCLILKEKIFDQKIADRTVFKRDLESMTRDYWDCQKEQ